MPLFSIIIKTDTESFSEEQYDDAEKAEKRFEGWVSVLMRQHGRGELWSFDVSLRDHVLMTEERVSFRVGNFTRK